MQKKRLYIALNILISSLAAMDMYAQSPTINVPAANITAQSNFLSSNIISGTLPGLAALTQITLGATTAGFIASNPIGIAAIPLSSMLYKVNTVNGVTQIGEPTITLSGTAQNVHGITVNLGAVSLGADYTVVTTGTAWQAGTYAASLSYVNLNPASQSLTLVVPAFLTANTFTPATSTMSITTLASFRAGGSVSATNSFDYYTTVPTDITLKATSATFAFSTTQLYNSIPVVTADKLSSLLSGSYAGSAINLSTTDQRISVSTGVPVVPTNKNSFVNTLSISAANLKSNFTQAGTYTIPLTYTVAKGSTVTFPTSLTSITGSTSVQLTVDKILELTIPATTVNLNFTSATAYAQGVTAVSPNPITLSSTVPYSVTVKGNGDFTTGSNTIPIGVMIVEGATGQTGVTSLPLTNASQSIISSANPVIDRAINLQFRIPATQTSNLLNKPAGTYSTSVTFTIVAP